jgi:coenzyme F420-0:L-glutamate ligase/coenzyme F420-1:gamma-L-glutamate ligase
VVKHAKPVEIIPIPLPAALRPEEATESDAGTFIVESIAGHGAEVLEGDIILVSSKIVSLFEGRTVRLEDVMPSRTARVVAWLFKKDPQQVELMLGEGAVAAVVPLGRVSRSKRAREMMRALARSEEEEQLVEQLGHPYEFMIWREGALQPEGGIDIMNSPAGYVSLLPENPCRSATSIGETLLRATGKHVGVILTDTASPLGRTGTLDLAVGFSGLVPMDRQLFEKDLYGELRAGSRNLVVDAVAAIAGQVMGQTTELTPIVVARGIPFAPRPHGDEEFDMASISYPRLASGPALVGTVFHTLVFRLVSLFSRRG